VNDYRELIFQVSLIRINQGKTAKKVIARLVIMIVLMMIDLKTEKLSHII
jgi:hypothetical protein